MIIGHGPFAFSEESGGLEGMSMNSTLEHLETLQEVTGFKERVSLAVGSEFNSSEDFFNNYEILKENNELIIQIYENYLANFNFIFPNGKKGDTVLFKIPSEHSSRFLSILMEQKQKQDSEISKYNIEYVIMDSPSLDNFGEDLDFLESSYSYLHRKAEQADKFIDIMDYQGDQKDFISNEENKINFSQINKDYEDKMRKLKAVKPFAKTYFPSEQQADLAQITFKELCDVFEKSGNLDWERITEANEELAELFRDYDTVKIKGYSVDIEFDIKGQGAINSVIATNYPGAEVYTAPNKQGVNGWIIYENQVRIKAIGETIFGLKFEFKDGRLESFDIVDERYSEKRKEELKNKLTKIFFAKEENRYLGELAFGTNFHVEPGFLHSLIGEKALGMHIALGEAYTDPKDMEGKNQKVDNGNHGADYHIDLIRKMDDGSVVTFEKDNGESAIIMDDGVFNGKSLPKLNKYQIEIKNNINSKQ